MHYKNQKQEKDIIEVDPGFEPGLPEDLVLARGKSKSGVITTTPINRIFSTWLK